MMMSREEENDIAFVVDNDNDTPQTTTTTQQRPRRVVPFRRRRQPPLLLLPVGTLSCLWIVVVALLSLSSSVQQRRGTMMVSSFVLRPAPAVTPLPSSSYVAKRVATTKNNRRLLPSAAVSSLSSTITSTAVTTASTVNGESEASAASASSWEDDNDTNAAADDVNIRLNVNEKARTVTAVCTSGTLCTVSSEPDIAGAPFGSFVDYVLDDEGNPVFLMNDRSMHTVNIRNAQENDDEKKALVTLFTQLGGGAGSPATTAAQSSSLGGVGGGSSIRLQDVSRCSVTGTLERMSADTAADWDAVRMRYSLTHAYADQVMDSPVFSFYRLRPAKIYFVGGFGVLAEWVDPADYAAAAPDILACEANSIMDRLHREHGQDLFLTAQQLLLRDENDEDDKSQAASSSSPTIEKIRVTNVDRLGMDVRVTRQLSTRRNKLQTDEFRIGFRIPVLSVEDAKSEILKVFQEAWERANGVTWGSSERPGDNVPIVKIAADALE